jgi:hypothetical protein
MMRGIFLQSESASAQYDPEVTPTEEGNQAILEIAEQLGVLEDEGIVVHQEKSIVKLDKLAQRARLVSQSTMVLAREVGDSDWVKLEKINKERQRLMKKISAKYNNKAEARVKQILKQQKSTIRG